MEKIVEKMCHAPAKCFRIKDRGYLREGYFADMVMFEKAEWQVTNDSVFYKCKWTPMDGQRFNYKVSNTIVNGNLVYNGEILEGSNGSRLEFDV